jgi:Ala-tRNA(Pro) deacylase
MTQNELLDLLRQRKIPYECVEHVPVFTIEEMLAAGIPHPQDIAKNLFVRDDKKRNYYLITVREEKRVDLKEFAERFGTRRLSFASEEDLERILGLTKGSVTPFGLLNEAEPAVHFYLDESFTDRMGIHPNINTATVFLAPKDLLSLLKEHGTSVTVAGF